MAGAAIYGGVDGIPHPDRDTVVQKELTDARSDSNLGDLRWLVSGWDAEYSLRIREVSATATRVPQEATGGRAAAAGVATPEPAREESGITGELGSPTRAWITWYSTESCLTDECLTYTGERTRPGGAACGWAYDIGATLTIVATGQTVVCNDRGGGPYYWIDVWQGWYTGWSEVR